MSQAELARRVKVRPATISAMESGKSRGVYFDVLARVAHALGVDPALLIATTAAPVPPRPLRRSK